MDTGIGTTIGFGTTSFTAELLSLNGNDFTREDVDVSHMGSTNFKEYQPGDLVDGGSIEIEIGFDPDDQPPVSSAAETITITFPVASGNSSGATLVFTGYVNSWSFSVPMEDKMTASATIKVDGKTEPVWTDGS